jgi:hypothetical protein
VLSERRNHKLATNAENKNVRELCMEINYIQEGYQPRNNLVQDENGDLLADSHNIV